MLGDLLLVHNRSPNIMIVKTDVCPHNWGIPGEHTCTNKHTHMWTHAQMRLPSWLRLWHTPGNQYPLSLPVDGPTQHPQVHTRSFTEALQYVVHHYFTLTATKRQQSETLSALPVCSQFIVLSFSAANKDKLQLPLRIPPSFSHIVREHQIEVT